MKNIKTLCYSVIIAVFLPCTVFSESNYSDSGKVGLSFLTLAPSARIASLGGGGSAIMTGVSSLWSNPSLLAFADERAVQLTHTKWVEGINQEFAAFSTATGFGTIGLSAQLFDSGDIDGRGEYGQSTGTYSITNSALALSYAVLPKEWIAAGFTYKRLFQKLSQETAGGYAFDFGVTMITPFEGFVVAGAFRNYGIMQKLKSTRTKLPSNFTLGCNYHEVIPGIDRPFSIIADFFVPRYGDTGVRLGMELEAFEYVPFRIGYRSDSEFEDLIFGIGFNWGIVCADMSYSAWKGTSEDVMRFTISVAGF